VAYDQHPAHRVHGDLEGGRDLIGALFSDIETGVAGPQFWPAMTAYVDALADEQARMAGQDAGNG
jgi:hypothetical protein